LRVLFTDRGEIEMRGFEEPVRLFAVRWREIGEPPESSGRA
jgi:class 3 adenylate cyclase